MLSWQPSPASVRPLIGGPHRRSVLVHNCPLPSAVARPTPIATPPNPRVDPNDALTSCPPLSAVGALPPPVFQWRFFEAPRDRRLSLPPGGGNGSNCHVDHRLRGRLCDRAAFESLKSIEKLWSVWRGRT